MAQLNITFFRSAQFFNTHTVSASLALLPLVGSYIFYVCLGKSCGHVDTVTVFIFQVLESEEGKAAT